MGKVREYLGRKSTKLIGGVLALATISGTFGGNEGGLPPLWTRKTGNSYGINIGLKSEFAEGSNHYGMNISGLTIYTGGNMNGISANLFSGGDIEAKAKKGGRDIRKSGFRGLELGLANIDIEGTREVNGLQVGVVNQNAVGKNAQIGVYNSSGAEGRKTKRGILFNGRWDESFVENR